MFDFSYTASKTATRPLKQQQKAKPSTYIAIIMLMLEVFFFSSRNLRFEIYRPRGNAAFRVRNAKGEIYEWGRHKATHYTAYRYMDQSVGGSGGGGDAPLIHVECTAGKFRWSRPELWDEEKFMAGELDLNDREKVWRI
ncbi:hypothetical protein Zmor_022060 [Zophobas morio]|uniref:Uncharacterized protein n=1 Tax=Zophobas morio TaxID=2755281 RepID=A0AA38I9Q7_9CUCU|nr:hypothetical protein Zmor_022060 [Zophobas morio]